MSRSADDKQKSLGALYSFKLLWFCRSPREYTAFNSDIKATTHSREKTLCMQQNCSLRAKIILEHLHTNLNESVYCPEEITQHHFQTFHLHSSFIRIWQSGPIVSMNFTDYCQVPPFACNCVVIGSHPSRQRRCRLERRRQTKQGGFF